MMGYVSTLLRAVFGWLDSEAAVPYSSQNFRLEEACRGASQLVGPGCEELVQRGRSRLRAASRKL